MIFNYMKKRRENIVREQIYYDLGQETAETLYKNQLKKIQARHKREMNKKEAKVDKKIKELEDKIEQAEDAKLRLEQKEADLQEKCRILEQCIDNCDDTDTRMGQLIGRKKQLHGEAKDVIYEIQDSIVKSRKEKSKVLNFVK